MNLTHLHLFITHLPIFGSILGAFVLMLAIYQRNNQTKIAAYFLFMISSAGAGIAYLTGESAEETIEDIPGVLKAAIEAHEEFALYALVSLIILGLTSVLALLITMRNFNFTRFTAFVMLLISLLSFALVARTGYLGGQIRHTELSTNGISVSDGTDLENDID